MEMDESDQIGIGGGDGGETMVPIPIPNFGDDKEPVGTEGGKGKQG